MKMSLFKINLFVAAKIPLAFIAGIRVFSISPRQTGVSLKHRWINQNPFKSVYWAVQGMASELATGILLMQQINASGKNISMLVTGQEGQFFKKAKGTIVFTCTDAIDIAQIIQRAVETGEGQVFELTSKGKDAQGDEVSSFTYKWSIKLKK